MEGVKEQITTERRVKKSRGAPTSGQLWFMKYLPDISSRAAAYSGSGVPGSLAKSMWQSRAGTATSPPIFDAEYTSRTVIGESSKDPEELSAYGALIQV